MSFTSTAAPSAEDISLLIEEISQGIKNLNNVSDNNDVLELRRECGGSEARVALHLFRRYADIANTIKDDCTSVRQGGVSGGGVLDNVPTFFYEGNRDDPSGSESFRKNVFWYRAIVGVLAMTVFIVFVSTPAIHVSTIRPDKNNEVKYNLWACCRDL
jgi:hypothetical protein